MIHLSPLSQSGFEIYRQQAALEYRPLGVLVEKRLPPGFPLPGSPTFECKLPQGIGTPNQSLFEIRLDDGQSIGVLWVDLSQGPSIAVLCDVWINPSYRRQGYATQALHALEPLLCQLGSTKIAVSVYGEQQAALGLLEKLGYPLTNLHMLRDLSQPLQTQRPPAPPVTLASIDEPTFQAYLAQTISAYAKERVQAGNWSFEDALERARQEFNRLLPQGRLSSDHNLYNILTEDTCIKVGVVWWGPIWNGKLAYLWDFLVYESHRGRGYAKGALFTLEEIVRAAGHPLILLHVFSHNHTARALYEKAGYYNCNYEYVKTLQG